MSLSLLFATLGPCSEPAPAPEVTSAEHALASASATDEKPAPAPGQQQTPTTLSFMRDHAKEAMDMRRAVIAGRFDLLQRASAVVVSDAWSPNLRPDYLPHVTAVRAAASAARDARSVQAAGAALGRLGEACGNCHREHGGPPQPALGENVSAAVGVMAVHVDAERALWEGLFTPSEQSWKRGAERLAGAPELSSDVEDVAMTARQLHDVALEAVASKPRADLYGSMMATCSSCHRRLNIEPK